MSSSETHNPGDVVILGVPSDHNSSFLRGAAQAPELIRAAFHSPSANLTAENGLGLSREPRLHDAGDLDLSNEKQAFPRITAAVANLLQEGSRVLSLGGDHSITYPILQAYGAYHPDLTLLQIDAHPDLYDELDGSRLSHACPFARIMEEGLVGRLVQVGIRTMTGHQREQARRFGVETIEMRSWSPEIDLKLSGPIYLSLDLDALDPAFVPGTSHYEPGGFSTREVLGIIQRLPAPLVGADIVEYNPERDIQGVTAMLAAKCLKEIAAQMLSE